MDRGVGGEALPLNTNAEQRATIESAPILAENNAKSRPFQHNAEKLAGVPPPPQAFPRIVHPSSAPDDTGSRFADDHRNLESRERHIKIHVRNVASGLFSIALDELRARHAAGMFVHSD